MYKKNPPKIHKLTGEIVGNPETMLENFGSVRIVAACGFHEPLSLLTQSSTRHHRLIER